MLDFWPWSIPCLDIATYGEINLLFRCESLGALWVLVVIRAGSRRRDLSTTYSQSLRKAIGLTTHSRGPKYMYTQAVIVIRHNTPRKG